MDGVDSLGVVDGVTCLGVADIVASLGVVKGVASRCVEDGDASLGVVERIASRGVVHGTAGIGVEDWSPASVSRMWSSCRERQGRGRDREIRRHGQCSLPRYRRLLIVRLCFNAVPRRAVDVVGKDGFGKCEKRCRGLEWGRGSGEEERLRRESV